MTLFSIFRRYQGRILLTLTLVLAETFAILLFPLVIGFAIDDLLESDYTGLIKLGLLGFGLVISGSLRRFYDTRVYSKIYVDLSSEIVENYNNLETSVINARVTMLKELVEFLENQLPELINSVVGLVGIVGILYFLDIHIFWGCLLVLLLIIIVFIATGKRSIYLNRHYNNVMEKQVVMIDQRTNGSIRSFMKNLMHWNIKLSDLETIVFGIIWLAMTVLIIFSVVESVGANNTIKAGKTMSIVMYVFQFADDAGILPLYFQQFLRLKEISSRLKNEK